MVGEYQVWYNHVSARLSNPFLRNFPNLHPVNLHQFSLSPRFQAQLYPHYSWVLTPSYHRVGRILMFYELLNASQFEIVFRARLSRTSEKFSSAFLLFLHPSSDPIKMQHILSIHVFHLLGASLSVPAQAMPQIRGLDWWRSFKIQHVFSPRLETSSTRRNKLSILHFHHHMIPLKCCLIFSSFVSFHIHLILYCFVLLPERNAVSDSGRVLGTNMEVLCYQSYPGLMYPTLKNAMFTQNSEDRGRVHELL